MPKPENRNVPMNGSRIKIGVLWHMQNGWSTIHRYTVLITTGKYLRQNLLASHRIGEIPETTGKRSHLIPCILLKLPLPFILKIGLAVTSLIYYPPTDLSNITNSSVNITSSNPD